MAIAFQWRMSARVWLPVLACLTSGFFAIPGFAAPPGEPVCKPGQSVSEDTEGHCCWAGQAWRNRCVGKPLSCPVGMDIKGETCVETPCPAGQEKMPDHAHCCWMGQAWSKSREKCIGIPVKCPAGTVVDAGSEQCAPKPALTPAKVELKAPAAPKSVPAAPQTAKPVVTCPAGQSVGPDTEGHCCWSGQAWQNRCVGRPSACPSGWQAAGEQCVDKPCEPGMEKVGSGDAMHCCWPGQAWAKSREVCVGVPTRCPDKMTADSEKETCKGTPVASAAPTAVTKPRVAPAADEAVANKPGEAGKCPQGQEITPDTAGHCCPPDNRWSTIRAGCVAKLGKQMQPSAPVAAPEAPPVKNDPPAKNDTPAPGSAVQPAKTKKPIRVEFEAAQPR